MSLDAGVTLAAVVHVLAAQGDDLERATRYAVSLGGNTGTVAATADAARGDIQDAVQRSFRR